jgi:hypothetical protein
MTIKVEHPNGLSGILYGRSSLAIYDQYGHEILHTGSRNVNTEDELYDILEKTKELLDSALLKGK